MSVATTRCAGLVSRGVAFLLDASVAILVCTVGFQLTRAVLAVIGIQVDAGERAGALGYLLALPVVFGVYCAGLWSLIGRTLGMLALGLRVVTVDGRPPGVRRSIVRALGYWVSAIGMVGFAWIAVDARRQGFHDKLARTLVVYDWDGADAPREGSLDVPSIVR